MSNEEILEKGVNDSLIHVDFMVGSDDLHIVGIREDGSETDIFVNGTGQSKSAFFAIEAGDFLYLVKKTDPGQSTVFVDCPGFCFEKISFRLPFSHIRISIQRNHKFCCHEAPDDRFAPDHGTVVVARDKHHRKNNFSEKLNKTRQQRKNLFSECLQCKAAAVDEAERKEERNGYTEVAGSVSEDSRVGRTGDQMNHRRCKRSDKENQACGHAEAENISIANTFPYALPVVRAAVLCHICVDCLCHRGKRHHRERKQLSCGSMSRNCFIAEAVDARLQDDRTNVNDTAHESH